METALNETVEEIQKMLSNATNQFRKTTNLRHSAIHHNYIL